MAQKGTCGNCERENVTLVSGNHCNTCYRAVRGIKDLTLRVEALAEIKRQIWSGEVRVREGKLPEVKIKEYHENDYEDQTPIPTLADNILGKQITVDFAGADMEIYHALQEAYVANRRGTVQDEILCILEEAMSDRIFKTGRGYLSLRTNREE